MTPDELFKFRTTGRGRGLFRYSVDLFTDFLRKIKNNSKFVYRITDRDVAGWDAFVNYWGAARVGRDLIQRWTEYGFQSWFNSGTVKDYNHAIRYNWVFNGGTAVKRWNALSGEARTLVVRKGVKQDFGVKHQKPTPVSAELLTVIRPAEERIKSRFFNTLRGIAWCVANTTLYNHKSRWCVLCKNKDDCLVTLKREYPSIAKIRGYVKEK